MRELTVAPHLSARQASDCLAGLLPFSHVVSLECTADAWAVDQSDYQRRMSRTLSDLRSDRQGKTFTGIPQQT